MVRCLWTAMMPKKIKYLIKNIERMEKQSVDNICQARGEKKREQQTERAENRKKQRLSHYTHQNSAVARMKKRQQ